MCRYLVYCSPFSVALDFPMFKIDLGVSVFCNLIGRSFSHHVGFKKGQEAGLMLEGEVVALPAYFCHVPFMKISTLCLLNSMLFIKYFESDFLEK